MSASREKKTRQELIDSGWTDPKAIEEAQHKEKEKRNNILYGVIAAIIVLAIIASMVWRSNVIQEKSTAVTIDGEKYTTSQVTYYYMNAYSAFLTNYYSVLSYLGVDTNTSMITQTISEAAAAVLGVEAGSSWHDFFVDNGVKQMAAVQNGLKAAEEAGFVYPESVQTQYDATIMNLETSAEASNMSAEQYLKNVYGNSITVETYKAELMRTLQYEAYLGSYTDSLSYSLDELEAAYAADPISYDRVSYSALTVYAAPETQVDADGNALEPTEEEMAAAMAETKKVAEEIQAKYNAGASMRIVAGDYDNINYDGDNNIAYSGDLVTTWLFDDARKPGDCEILENGSAYTVVAFHERFREEYNTVNIRHILFEIPLGTLTSEDEGYVEERDRLNAETEAKAQAVLDEWLAGEATEESFAKLAMEHSVDSSKYDGGLYPRVYEEQMVMSFDLWCFDEARTPGETGIIESPYGYHIMYFVGEDIPRWQALVTDFLAYEEYAAYVEGLSANSEIQRHNLAMKFVG